MTAEELLGIGQRDYGRELGTSALTAALEPARPFETLIRFQNSVFHKKEEFSLSF